MAETRLAAILRLRTRQDVDDLLADIREARRRSERNGGTYTVFRVADAGPTGLMAIEIALPGVASPSREKEA